MILSLLDYRGVTQSHFGACRKRFICSGHLQCMSALYSLRVVLGSLRLPFVGKNPAVMKADCDSVPTDLETVSCSFPILQARVHAHLSFTQPG